VRAFIRRSILRPHRSSPVGTIAGLGLAIMIAAGIWACSHSESASQVLPKQVEWPMAGVPAMAQRAVAYVRAKWQPDAFLTSIQMEATTGVSNAQSVDGGVLVQFGFYSPGQQQTLTFMPNLPGSQLIAGSSADPRDERALPANFVDLPDAVTELRAKGLRAKRIKSAQLQNYGRGSYVGGGIGVFGSEWVIDSAFDEWGAVVAELPNQDEATMAGSGREGDQSGNLIHVEITGLRNDQGNVYCQLFDSAKGWPLNTQESAESTASTITNRRASCDFESPDPGPYAILVFHDEDSSHVLELNANGTSREGVGLSNNPNLSSALPGYDAAKFIYRTGRLNLTVDVKYPLTQASDTTRRGTNPVLAGFAFVDSSVTGQGSRAKLPSGTKISPPGSTITGTDGCPTTPHHTDGLIVAVIDYHGRPTAGSLTVTRHPATGGQFKDAPYYLDLDPGPTLQYLGPIFENGSYDVRFQYDYSLGRGKMVSAAFVLARSCPAAP
jgi:uncharacterized protein (DUF2141 family)